jgi:translation initiation factor IF-2
VWKKKQSKQRKLRLRKHTILISKFSGTKLTGQTIDLSQFNKPKRKRRAKITPISLVLLVLQELIKINKKLLLNRYRDLLEFLVPNPNKIT